MNRCILIVTLLFLLASCQSKPDEPDVTQPEATSLLGVALYPRELDEATRLKLEKNLNEARVRYDADSTDEMSIIWYGRRLAYLGRYREAIDVFSKGLEAHPDSYKLLRHRGHRFITTRKFSRAIEDLSRAADLAEGSTPEIEPDGQPNKLNIPLSTNQWNILYHLALAYYLNGDFEKALEVYQRCYETSDNPDILVAAADWYYMTLMRMGMPEKAAEVVEPINEGMEIIENESYFKRIMMYKGAIPADSLLSVSTDDPDASLSLATQGYGVGNWFLYNGDTTQATTIFNRVLEGDYWAAFGFIAAEADLARLRTQL